MSGRYLWITDASGEPFLHLVDRDSGVVIRSFGRQGAGPGEFASVGRMFESRTSEFGVVVYDEELNRLTNVELDSAGVAAIGDITALPTSPIPSAVTSLGRGFLGWLTDTNRRWVTFHAGGASSSFIPGPLLGPSSVPFSQRIAASANLKVCVKPDQSRFAVLYGSAGRIELHDSTAAFLGLAAVPDSTNGDFETENGGTIRWDRQRYYYSGCAATDRFLFALFSGKNEGPESEMTYAADLVQVYDWSGRLQGVLSLTATIVRLAVDDAGTVFYGSGIDGQTIFRFDVPERFRGADS